MADVNLYSTFKIRVRFFLAYVRSCFQMLESNKLVLAYPLVVGVLIYNYLENSVCSIVLNSEEYSVPFMVELYCGLSFLIPMLVMLTAFAMMFFVIVLLAMGLSGIPADHQALRLLVVVSFVAMLYNLYQFGLSMIGGGPESSYLVFSFILILAMVASFMFNGPPLFPRIELDRSNRLLAMNGEEYSLENSGRVVLSRSIQSSERENNAGSIADHEFIQWELRIQSGGKDITIYSSGSYPTAHYTGLWYPLEVVARELAKSLEYEFVDRTGIVEIFRQVSLNENVPLVSFLRSEEFGDQDTYHDHSGVDDLGEEVQDKISDDEQIKAAISGVGKVSSPILGSKVDPGASVQRPLPNPLQNSLVDIETVRDGYVLKWSYLTAGTRMSRITESHVVRVLIVMLPLLVLMAELIAVYYLSDQIPGLLESSIVSVLFLFLLVFYYYFFFNRGSVLEMNSRRVRLRKTNLSYRIAADILLLPVRLVKRIVGNSRSVDIDHSYPVRSVKFNQVEGIQIAPLPHLPDLYIELITTEGRLRLPGEYFRYEAISLKRTLQRLLTELANYDPTLDFTFEVYRCFNCSKPIDYEDKICGNCSTVAPKCIVCFINPDEGDEVIRFDCCTSFAHMDHAISWLRERKMCPYCKTLRPNLIKIEGN